MSDTNYALEVARWLKTNPGPFVGETREELLAEVYEHCPVRCPGVEETTQIDAFETILQALGYKVQNRNRFNEAGEVAGHFFQLNLPEEPRGEG